MLTGVKRFLTPQNAGVVGRDQLVTTGNVRLLPRRR
jgi:hypothetical protein